MPQEDYAGLTRFVTSRGSDGFVDARVQARMKGASFVWTRAGMPPAEGSRFEIRPKSGFSVLDPSTPTGVDESVRRRIAQWRSEALFTRIACGRCLPMDASGNSTTRNSK